MGILVGKKNNFPLLNCFIVGGPVLIAIEQMKHLHTATNFCLASTEADLFHLSMQMLPLPSHLFPPASSLFISLCSYGQCLIGAFILLHSISAVA